MHAADGFVKSPKTKPSTSPLNPSFSSAFDTQNRPGGAPRSAKPAQKSILPHFPHESNLSTAQSVRSLRRPPLTGVLAPLAKTKRIVVLPQPRGPPPNASFGLDSSENALPVLSPALGTPAFKPVRSPLPPFPVSHPLSKSMCTISTTRIALSSELRRTLPPAFNSVTLPIEIHRGILRSPEKDKGKGKNRYLRFVNSPKFF